jgi:hypothetical protein
LHYYAGVYNGNNRNQPADNDNGKNYYARLESEFGKNLKVGFNGAGGSAQNKRTSAWGADLTAMIPLRFGLVLELMGEYKEGANAAAFNSAGKEAGPLYQYRNRGAYIFPNIRYQCNRPRLRSVEFSSRYEYLEENYRMNNNPRQTITPMVSLEFADDYFARVQLGFVFDMYKKAIPLTTQCKQNVAVAQLQVRF